MPSDRSLCRFRSRDKQHYPWSQLLRSDSSVVHVPLPVREWPSWPSRAWAPRLTQAASKGLCIWFTWLAKTVTEHFLFEGTAVTGSSYACSGIMYCSALSRVIGFAGWTACAGKSCFVGYRRSRPKGLTLLVLSAVLGGIGRHKYGICFPAKAMYHCADLFGSWAVCETRWNTELFESMEPSRPFVRRLEVEGWRRLKVDLCHRSLSSDPRCHQVAFFSARQWYNYS